MLSSLTLFGGVLAVPASAHHAVVKAHIAVGCQASMHRHQRHHRMHRQRCQAARLGHVLAHMA